MGFQTVINTKLAGGVVGEYTDDSPHRERGYILLSKVTDGVKAEGELTFTANPEANDTITVANVTYTFKSTLAAANDVKIGANLAATLTSLAKVINGTATAGTDCYAGTKDLAAIMEAEATSTKVVLTMKNAGIEGNYTALTSGDVNAVATPFAGGVDESVVLPKIACAFTETGTNGQARIGGTGAFAGVFVQPKMYANLKGLNATLEVESGSQGGLCTFGHINVITASDFAAGYVAAYNNANGVINAYANAGVIPAGFTQIANASFINGGSAGELAVLQLGN